ncbi:unnamed protein product [Prorocentrum cordatum]|uniref:Uncharacterized protein n=1 Tax=Prorocentrum cordatum TaxID=2364126 RepID=A0ABN9W0N0_9DINO|nr:unnamed protein product [Polarella glacialis]
MPALLQEVARETSLCCALPRSVQDLAEARERRAPEAPRIDGAVSGEALGCGGPAEAEHRAAAVLELAGLQGVVVHVHHHLAEACGAPELPWLRALGGLSRAPSSTTPAGRARIA